MDDLIFLHEDKAHLQSCLADISEVATKELKIEFNAKTQIFPISKGVDYLGWRFYLTDSGKAISRSLASYVGHLQHGHTWKLQTKVYDKFVLTKAPKESKQKNLQDKPCN